MIHPINPSQNQVVEPLRLTIMVRSPDVAATRDNTIARRIRFLLGNSVRTAFAGFRGQVITTINGIAIVVKYL